MKISTKTFNPHRRPFTLFLHLEYLQAEFYLLALNGSGLTDGERGTDEVTTTGGRRVEFENPLVEAFVKQAAEEERNHVRLLRELLSEIESEPPSAPPIELKNSFTRFARDARLCAPDETFDPFLNDTNFLLAAYIFEDVATSAYLGSLPAIVDKRCLELIASIMAVEASQSSIVRFMLLASGLSLQTNAISLYRQRISQLMGTVYQAGDHGVGTLLLPSCSAADSRSLAMPRSQKQCCQILCGNEAGKPGLFFPEGLGAPSLLAHIRFKPQFASSFATQSNGASASMIEAYPSEPVDLPALPLSEESLRGFDIRENISTQPWSETAYVSYAPHVLSLNDAILHGSVGIIASKDTVLAETLWHTDPGRHRYVWEQEHVVLDTESMEPLEGTTVSILVGGAESYWHSLIDATARLILVPEHVWQHASRVLLPSTGIQQLELARIFGLPDHVSPRVVQPTETFCVETLIYPSSLCGLLDYHASLLNKVFDRLAANVPRDGSAFPKRIYIDRRGSPLRRLVNEDDVIAALPLFTPVKLETLTMEQQIQLFSQAEIVVAPHGAGLANIGFIKPGRVVIELMMDTYCMWCFRRLAAVRGLDYRPVLGKSLDVWKAAESVHLQTWSIDIPAVLSAVDRAETHLSRA